MIGERLYDLRKDAGLTQDEPASILSVNKHSISSYERGKSEPPDIIKIEIAKFFRVSVDYLLGVTDDPGAYDGAHYVLRLPPLSEEVRKSLQDYADFLVDRYRHTSGDEN